MVFDILIVGISERIIVNDAIVCFICTDIDGDVLVEVLFVGSGFSLQLCPEKEIGGGHTS